MLFIYSNLQIWALLLLLLLTVYYFNNFSWPSLLLYYFSRRSFATGVAELTAHVINDSSGNEQRTSPQYHQTTSLSSLLVFRVACWSWSILALDRKMSLQPYVEISGNVYGLPQCHGVAHTHRAAVACLASIALQRLVPREQTRRPAKQLVRIIVWCGCRACRSNMRDKHSPQNRVQHLVGDVQRTTQPPSPPPWPTILA